MPRYRAQLSDGRTLVFESDTEPAEADILSTVQKYDLANVGTQKAVGAARLASSLFNVGRSAQESMLVDEAKPKPSAPQETLLETINRKAIGAASEAANIPGKLANLLGGRHPGMVNYVEPKTPEEMAQFTQWLQTPFKPFPEVASAVANVPGKVVNVLGGRQPGMVNYIEPKTAEDVTRFLHTTPSPDDKPFVTAAKELGNLLISIPEFAESPLGVLTAGAGATGKFGSKAMRYAFAADMFLNSPALFKGWSTMTSQEQIQAITRMLGTASMVGLLTHPEVRGTVKDPLLNPQLREGQLRPDIFGLEPKPLPVAPELMAGGAVATMPPMSREAPAEEALRRVPEAGQFGLTDVMARPETALTKGARFAPPDIQDFEAAQRTGLAGQALRTPPGARVPRPEVPSPLELATPEQKAETLQNLRPAVKLVPEAPGEPAKVAVGEQGDVHDETIKREGLTTKQIDRRIAVVGKEGEAPPAGVTSIENVTEVPRQTIAQVNAQAGVPAKVEPGTATREPEGHASEMAKAQRHQQLRQLGLSEQDISDLESGQASVSDVVARKLPGEEGRGPDHAKALEEARIQAIGDIERALSGDDKPNVISLLRQEGLTQQQAESLASDKVTPSEVIKSQLKEWQERMWSAREAGETGTIEHDEAVKQAMEQATLRLRDILEGKDPNTGKPYEPVSGKRSEKDLRIPEGQAPAGISTLPGTETLQPATGRSGVSGTRLTYGERYIEELGIDKARERIDHLNRRTEEELAKRPIDQAAIKRLQQEAQNIANAVEKQAKAQEQPPPLTEAQGKYLYHAISEEGLATLRERGIYESPPGYNKKFATTSEEAVKKWVGATSKTSGERTRLIRFSSEGVRTEPSKIWKNSFSIESAVPPENIEVLENGKWVRLKPTEPEPPPLTEANPLALVAKPPRTVAKQAKPEPPAPVAPEAPKGKQPPPMAPEPPPQPAAKVEQAGASIPLSPEAKVLLDKVPADISQFTGNHHLLREALSNGRKPLAVAEGDKYTVRIIPDRGVGFGRGIIVVESKQKPGFPVVTGSWMDQWEPYMKQNYDVSKQAYGQVPEFKRAEMEAWQQLSHWLEGKKSDVFPEHFARTYHPEEFAKWMEENKRPSKDNPKFKVSPFWSAKSVKHWRERFLTEEPPAPAPPAQVPPQPAAKVEQAGAKPAKIPKKPADVPESLWANEPARQTILNHEQNIRHNNELLKQVNAQIQPLLVERGQAEQLHKGSEAQRRMGGLGPNALKAYRLNQEIKALRQQAQHIRDNTATEKKLRQNFINSWEVGEAKRPAPAPPAQGTPPEQGMAKPIPKPPPPPMEGPGGAPAEGEILEGTALKNATADLERAGVGLPEAYPTVTHDMAAAWVRSGEVERRSPGAGKKLADDLIANPERNLTDDDSALLLRYKVDLFNRMNAAAERTHIGDKSAREKADIEHAALVKEFGDLLDAVKFRGSEWGREGRWRQAMAREDFTFDTIDSLERYRRTLTDKPMNDAQKARGTQIAAEVKRRNKAAEEANAKVTDEILHEPDLTRPMSNAERRAFLAAKKTVREWAIKRAKAENKLRVAEAERDQALYEIDEASKAAGEKGSMDATRRKAVAKAEAEKKARLAKAVRNEKLARLELDRVDKAEQSIARHRRVVAMETARQERAERADPIKGVLRRIKEYVDKGEFDFNEIRNKVAADMGISNSQFMRLLGRNKRVKYLTDDMFRKQKIARDMQIMAKNWVRNMDIPIVNKALASVPSTLFRLKVGFHGTVALGTHAPMVAFQPRFWELYARNFGRMYGMAFNTAYYERQVQDLQRRPNYIKAQRAGLVNDPFQYEEFAISGTPVEGKAQISKDFINGWNQFTGMGNRGYAVLKIIRQDMFDQMWNRLPKKAQIPEVAKAIADGVNHATGVVKGMAPRGTNLALFAPRLEASRVMWMVGDPGKMVATFANWKNASVGDKVFAMNQLKEKAWVAGTFFSMLALRYGSVFLRRRDFPAVFMATAMACAFAVAAPCFLRVAAYCGPLCNSLILELMIDCDLPFLSGIIYSFSL